MAAGSSGQRATSLTESEPHGVMSAGGFLVDLGVMTTAMTMAAERVQQAWCACACVCVCGGGGDT